MPLNSISSKIKTVYIFGAGYSCSANFPVQKQILDRVYQIENDFTTPVKNFIKELFGENTPSLEDIYTILDRTISKRDNLGGMHFNDLDTIRDLLNKSVLYVMHLASQKFFESEPYNKELFVEKENKNKSDDKINFIRSFYSQNAEYFINERLKYGVQSDTFSIISLNWDTLIEDLIYKCKKNIAPKKIDIDYCTYTNPLEDSTHVPSFKQKSSKINNIKILKLHSSANWLICPNCNRLFTGLGASKDNLSLYVENVNCPKCLKISDKFIKTPICPVLEPFLISPTFLKNIDGNPHISMIWHNAYVELSEADKIVFVGYSLPDSDYLLRTLFKRSIPKQTKIDIVLTENDKVKKNTSKNQRNFFAEERYRSFFPKSMYELEFFFDGTINYFSNFHFIKR